jgi:2-succinyl-5-enolpyruvyl-6-hydroxy-3-cyclohexene-1-carboxylate synthase
MIPINRTYAPLQAFVEELARCGVREAVTCPGSRNAPLLLTLQAEPRIRCLSVLDERSAGFAAIGMAKASGRPVVVTCTSGTAAANLMPAVAEAREGRVPLIVLTADRPPELRDVGAGQAIDQVKLFGAHAKWFVEVGNHDPGRESAVHHRGLACRAWATSRHGRPGPVHLNFPLREPLAPVAEELDSAAWQGRSGGRPWVSVADPLPVVDPGAVAELAARVGATPHGAIVCGSSCEEVAGPATLLAALLGWPLLAEPTSGVRCGAHDRGAVVAHYDAYLRDAEWARAHAPDLVLRVGDAPTSKPLRAWLSAAPQVVVDRFASWHEPTRMAEWILPCSAPWLLSELVAGLGEPHSAPGWLESWRAADALVPPALAGAPDPFEPKAYAALDGALEDGDQLWVASSMPIRDVETFFPSTPARIRFLSNRGANGIDGVVSSALGARVATGARTVLLTGDLSLLHDLGGLVAARRQGVELTILCVNNDGGGIFDFLPLAAHADPSAYVEQVATPSGIDLAEVATLAGLRHLRARTPEDVRAAVREPGLVEVRTDRVENVRLHREVFARVAAGLARETAVS